VRGNVAEEPGEDSHGGKNTEHKKRERGDGGATTPYSTPTFEVRLWRELRGIHRTKKLRPSTMQARGGGVRFQRLGQSGG